MSKRFDCALIVNAALGESALVELVLPHLVRTHKVSFDEVLVVLDCRPKEGRLAAAQGDDRAKFHQLVESVGAANPARLVEVDYSETTVSEVAQRWFDETPSLRCSAGTPIYPFIFGMDRADAKYRLHVDCDMLFFDPGPSWIEKGIDVLVNYADVLFVNPSMGPHDPVLGQHEFLASEDPNTGLRQSHGFSTRAFLFDAAKLASALLPLVAHKHGVFRRLRYRAQGRPPFLALERTIARNLESSGRYRCDLEPRDGFCLHAWDRTALLDGGGQRVIRDIERGHVPRAQFNHVNLINPW
jgi:hypothetical protein